MRLCLAIFYRQFNMSGTDDDWEITMVSDRIAPASEANNSGNGFSGGMVAASFVGALAALLIVIGVQEAVDTDTPTEPKTGGSLSFDVPAEGIEEFVAVATLATSAELTFSEPGTYRIELRGLDGTSDPVLALFGANSTTATVTNDDTDGLDAMVPVTVSDADETWRVELTSYGETGGPGVLRVLPAPEGFVAGTAVTEGPGGFPDGEISALELDNPATSRMSENGAWYTFSPLQSGRHVISVRAADESLDTVAHLLPVLPGSEAPAAGTDITTMQAAFTSDDDDGFNPRFERYLQKGAAYYLFVRGFDETAEGSFAVTASFLGEDASEAPQSALEVEEHIEETHEEPVPDVAPTIPRSGNSQGKN